MSTLLIPGDAVVAGTGALRGHGTREDEKGVLRATVRGRLERVNKLVRVQPDGGRYSGEVGDVVVGRVREISAKRWRVDVQGRRDAQLHLSAVHLADGVQRRKTEADELHMRSVLREGDLVVAEVQQIKAAQIEMFSVKVLEKDRTMSELADGVVNLVAAVRDGATADGLLEGLRPVLLLKDKLHAAKVEMAHGEPAVLARLESDVGNLELALRVVAQGAQALRSGAVDAQAHLQRAVPQLGLATLALHLTGEAVDPSVGGATVDSLLSAGRQLLQIVAGVLRSVDSPNKDGAVAAAQAAHASATVVMYRVHAKAVVASDVRGALELLQVTNEVEVRLEELVQAVESLRAAYLVNDRDQQMTLVDAARRMVQQISATLRRLMQSLHVIDAWAPLDDSSRATVFATAASRLAQLPSATGVGSLAQFRSPALDGWVAQLLQTSDTLRKVFSALPAATNPALTHKLVTTAVARLLALVASAELVFTACVTKPVIDVATVRTHQLMACATLLRLSMLQDAPLPNVPQFPTACFALAEVLMAWAGSLTRVAYNSNWRS